ncbi:MAG: hypothetical protein CM15mP115_13900 [Alphaproteobacteria bacterium]|nr:MAG: hypothetical protein CM15mP115_13900 [Alphaproteobacteria bacterium]
MTRIGLIGCGMWGRNLARNLAALGVLAGVADRYPDRAGDFAGEFGTSHVPVDELLAGHDLDGVVIAARHRHMPNLPAGHWNAGFMPMSRNRSP